MIIKPVTSHHAYFFLWYFLTQLIKLIPCVCSVLLVMVCLLRRVTLVGREVMADPTAAADAEHAATAPAAFLLATVNEEALTMMMMI